MDASPLHDRSTTTCVLADDHPPILDSITRYLAQSGFVILGTALDGIRALEAVTTLSPVVCIADVRMPKLDGLELARELAKVAPDTAVLLSAHVDSR
jgi:DNA-binding NarL/FixJ family response regulator